MDSTIQKLIEAVVNASPHIWEILVRQVYIEAWCGVAAALAFLFAGYWFVRRQDFDARGMMFLIGVIAACFLFPAIPRFLNPEYYAIRAIIETIH